MLDTNTVSYILKGISSRARQQLEKHSKDHEVCISAVTEAEVRFGIAKRKLTRERSAVIERFLASFDVLPWDSAAAKEYAEARTSLEDAGKPLANMDLLIAAHAASAGAVLVTSDDAIISRKRHFKLAGVVNWADDLPK